MTTESHQGVEDRDDPRQRRGTIAIGIVLVLFGVALLLQRTLAVDGHLVGRLWPIVLIVLGVSNAWGADDSRRGRGRRRGGVWLVFLGVWGLVSEFELFGLDFSTSWPLLVVGVGGLIVWKALEGAPPRRVRRER
jgi:hypothetical protein